MNDKWRVYSLMVLVFLLPLTVGCVEAQLQKDQLKEHSVKGLSSEIIIKFKADAFDAAGELTSESIRVLNTKYGLISMQPLFRAKTSGTPVDIYKLKFLEGLDGAEIAQEYAKDPSVIYAEQNYIIHAVEEGQDVD